MIGDKMDELLDLNAILEDDVLLDRAHRKEYNGLLPQWVAEIDSEPFNIED